MQILKHFKGSSHKNLLRVYKGMLHLPFTLPYPLIVCTTLKRFTLWSLLFESEQLSMFMKNSLKPYILIYRDYSLSLTKE